MAFKIAKRGIAPPSAPANQKPIQDLKFAVEELMGSVGASDQRAVRLGELLAAGILSLNTDGAAVAGESKYVSIEGDTMTGMLTVPYLVVKATPGSSSEGGEIMLKGAPTFSDAIIDNVGNTFRFFGGAADPLTYHRGNGNLTVPGTVFGYPVTYRGAFGTQSVLQDYGWSNGVSRWKWVLESDGAFSLWSYDSSGTTPTNSFTCRTPVASGLSVGIMVQGAVYSVGTGGAQFFYDRTTSRTFAWYGTSDTAFLFNGSGNVLAYSPTDVAFGPAADVALNCGYPSRRWATVYAATGTINTSDAREKTELVALTVSELSAAKAMAKEIGFYQWLAVIEEKGVDGARRHCGMTVQRAIEIMESFGLDPFRYGFICYDEWDGTDGYEMEGGLDDEGEPLPPVVIPAAPAGNRYSFRMDEFMMFIARGFDARLAALEAP